MSKKINLICGIVAILCVAVMFVPMGEERGHGNQFNQWLNVGQMQYAWGHATSGFTCSDPLYGTMVQDFQDLPEGGSEDGFCESGKTGIHGPYRKRH